MAGGSPCIHRFSGIPTGFRPPTVLMLVNIYIYIHIYIYIMNFCRQHMPVVSL